jgi:hypothetical protein
VIYEVGMDRNGLGRTQAGGCRPNTSGSFSINSSSRWIGMVRPHWYTALSLIWKNRATSCGEPK